MAKLNQSTFCYVQDREDNHIHFVDGTEGGYTTAALVYKSKINGDYWYFNSFYNASNWE